jgi:hypothetical protein
MLSKSLTGTKKAVQKIKIAENYVWKVSALFLKLLIKHFSSGTSGCDEDDYSSRQSHPTLFYIFKILLKNVLTHIRGKIFKLKTYWRKLSTFLYYPCTGLGPQLQKHNKIYNPKPWSLKL